MYQYTWFVYYSSVCTHVSVYMICVLLFGMYACISIHDLCITLRSVRMYQYTWFVYYPSVCTHVSVYMICLLPFGLYACISIHDLRCVYLMNMYEPHVVCDTHTYAPCMAFLAVHVSFTLFSWVCSILDRPSSAIGTSILVHCEFHWSLCSPVCSDVGTGGGITPPPRIWKLGHGLVLPSHFSEQSCVV